MTAAEPSLERILSRDPRAVARAITVVENQTAAGRNLLKTIFPHTGRAITIGITGAPGAYKGTIISSDGAQIPVVEVMTSPKGMMLLGDLPDGSVVVRVLRDSSGTLTATWGPVRPVITAKVTRAK